MLAKENDGKAYVPHSVLDESARDILREGLSTGVMSRQRALRLLGGALLGTMLVPMAGTNAAVASSAASGVDWLKVGEVIDLFKTAYETLDSLGVVDAFKGIVGLDEEDAKEAIRGVHIARNVGGFEITVSTQDPSDDDSESSTSAFKITIDDLSDPASARPQQTVRRGDQPLARPTGTEKEAYQRMVTLAPTQRLNDTWVTARPKLQPFYPAQLRGHDWSMLQAFYYTQNNILSIPYRRSWNSENYFIPKANYLAYFKNYGLLAQELRDIQPPLTDGQMQQTAETFYNKLNREWPLERMSPRAAYTMAYALYLGPS